jgi:aminobenzoyl-glutamate utilization protein B
LVDPKPVALNMKPIVLSLLLLPFFSAEAQITLKVSGEKDKEFALAELTKRHHAYSQIARQIWSYAELGFQENKSSLLLQETLKKEGFSVQASVAEMPTAFVATFGSGKPVIGILAEFDALPGLSQDSLPIRKPLLEGKAGHACGHNLFGTASTASAITIKDWLSKNKKTGTIKLFGTPAEEGGGAKVYMVRNGLFSDVDAVLHWHPSNSNDASPESCMAYTQAMFRFYGRSAHAAAAPEKGRSALDAVEAMNHMANLMREHIPSDTRIHYVITKGGLAANVVPDFAEVEYMVRHPDAKVVAEIWGRIVKCAEGAAMGTEVSMKYEVISGSYNLLPNETLARIMHDNLKKVGGVYYSPIEIDFAKKIQSSFDFSPPDLTQAQQIQPFKLGGFFPASTDVGDITWVVPTAGLGTAAWVPGVAPHSWQAVATGSNGIGLKAMLNAAKCISMTAIDLFNNPQIVDKAKKELIEKTGRGFQYKSLIGDRTPPLDYRKGLQ